MAIPVIHFDSTTSGTFYALIRNAAGNWLRTSDNTFVAWDVVGSHDVPMTEDANVAGLYTVSVNTGSFGSSAALLTALIFEQAGGSPNLTNDTRSGAQSLDWDGDEEASVGQVQEILEDTSTVAAIADAVWDEARTDHKSSGTFGEQATLYPVLDDFTFNADGNPTAATVYFYNTSANATTHDKATGLMASPTLGNISWSNNTPSAAAKYT